LIASLVCLCLSAAWLAIRPSLLLDPKIAPESVAWVYVALYGFALTGVYGLIYRVVPWVFHAPLYGSPFVILHLVFHAAGVLLLLPSAFQPESQMGVMGQTFLACGALIFMVNISKTFKQEARPDVSETFILTTLLWLGIMLGIGIPFASRPLVGLFSGTGWSAATLVLCMAGVVLNAVLGIALRVFPLRLGVATERAGGAWFAFVLVNSGTAWLFAATAFGPTSFVIFCAALYLAGVLLCLGCFTAILQARAGADLDWEDKILLTALWMIPVCVILFGFAAWTHPPQGEELIRGGAAVTLACLLGTCAPGLVALFYQTASLDEETRPLAPLPAQILLAAFFNYAVGILMLVPGVWLGIEKMLGLGSLFLAVGALGFFGNFLYILRQNPSVHPSDPARPDGGQPSPASG